jgi:hypothetical protein
MLQTDLGEETFELSFCPLAAPRRHYQHFQVGQKRFSRRSRVRSFWHPPFDNKQSSVLGNMTVATSQNCRSALVIPIMDNLLEEIYVSPSGHFFEEAASFDGAAIQDTGRR